LIPSIRSEPFGLRDFTLLYLAATYGLRWFDSLEAAQTFCEKNALDVELALHGDDEPPEAPSI
jgi:hypothetical protein